MSQRGGAMVNIFVSNQERPRFVFLPDLHGFSLESYCIFYDTFIR